MTAASLANVTGVEMGWANRKRYFESLSKDQLVDLMMLVLSENEDLSVFRLDESKFSFLGFPLDEGTTPPLLRMGQGLALPSEKDLLHLLVDDDTQVWSHHQRPFP